MRFAIRPGTIDDAPLILAFIYELAEYEKLSDAVIATEEVLRETLFGNKPGAEVLIASVDDQPAGFALFFHNFSTFLGLRGIYLEDLFVRPEFRGNGLGRILLAYLARLATERRCGRLEWSVLAWNKPAIGFYKNLGAEAMSDWTVHRLAGAALDTLAAEAET